MSIYIAMHKACDLPAREGYVPIQVGAALHEKLGVLTDDAREDNISEKNPNFCELTALYYIWKHTDDPVVGLVHYRRFFSRKKLSSAEEDIVSYEEFYRILDEHKIVLPQKHYFKTNNYEQYNKLHFIKDLDLCGEVIRELTPEYSDAFQEVMQRKYIYPYNMFVMTRKNYDAYAQWLFRILFELEKRIDISGYDAYNQRIWGFLSERLQNIWVVKQKLEIVNYMVYNNEETEIRHFREELENTIKKIL